MKNAGFMQFGTHRKVVRKGFATMVCIGLSLPSLIANAGEETIKADMRGIGKISATYRPSGDGASSWSTLAAEDAVHAGICASKLIADLTGFGDVKLIVGSKLPGTVLALEGSGQWIIGLMGANVQILFAREATSLSALAGKANARLWTPVALKAHPRWLDRFDNDAFAFGFLGFGELPKDVRKEVQWLAERKFNIAGECGNEDIMIAPGVFDFTVADWYAKIAARNDLAYQLYLTWAHARPGRPKWVWNKSPLPHVIPANSSVGSHDFLHRKLDNYTVFAPVSASDFALVASDMGIARHTAADPNFIANFGAAELGGCGIPDLELVAGLPETKAAWTAYLKTTLGLDLKTVGLRYKGSPSAGIRTIAWTSMASGRPNLTRRLWARRSSGSQRTPSPPVGRWSVATTPCCCSTKRNPPSGSERHLRRRRRASPL